MSDNWSSFVLYEDPDDYVPLSQEARNKLLYELEKILKDLHDNSSSNQ